MERIALTMLNCYSDIDFYVAGIETYVTRTAVYSYSGASLNRHKTTLQQTTDILTMIAKKEDLLSLKNLIESALKRLTDSQKVLVRKAFFEKMSREEIMEDMSLSKRTLYRRLHAAIESFAKSLMLEDFEEEWFTENCLSQSWIKSVYANPKLLSA